LGGRAHPRRIHIGSGLDLEYLYSNQYGIAWRARISNGAPYTFEDGRLSLKKTENTP